MGHWAHCVAAKADPLYVPGPQSTHCAEPSLAACFPGAHDVQAISLGEEENCPAGQGVHTVLPELESTKVPLPHSVQSSGLSWSNSLSELMNFPTVHISQVDFLGKL